METTMLSAVEHHAALISRAGHLLGHFLISTEPEKRDWAPTMGEGCTGRCATAQVEECIGLNNMLAAKMRGQTPPAPGADGHGAQGTLSAEEAAKQAVASADSLASAIRDGGEKALDAKYELPFGTFSGWMISEICMTNMHYHSGQINYIQLLYGDKEFHFPNMG